MELTLHVGVAVLLQVLEQGVDVELCRVEVADGVPVALLPVAHQIGQKAARPSDATFEEADAQCREPTGDAAEEQRLAQRLVAGR